MFSGIGNSHFHRRFPTLDFEGALRNPTHAGDTSCYLSVLSAREREKRVRYTYDWWNVEKVTEHRLRVNVEIQVTEIGIVPEYRLRD